MPKMRFLSSYLLTIVFIMIITGFLTSVGVFKKLTETLNTKMAQLINYERTLQIPLLNKKLDEYKAQVSALGLEFPNQAEATDIIIKYAESLRKTFLAQAATDRPISKDGVTSLIMNFEVTFQSPVYFLKFIQTLLDSNTPIVNIESLDISEDTNNNTVVYITLLLSMPYTDGKNE